MIDLYWRSKIYIPIQIKIYNTHYIGESENTRECFIYSSVQTGASVLMWDFSLLLLIFIDFLQCASAFIEKTQKMQPFRSSHVIG